MLQGEEKKDIGKTENSYFMKLMARYGGKIANRLCEVENSI